MRPGCSGRSAVRFLVHGLQFDEGIYTDDGHIEVDIGLDTLFLYDGPKLSPFTQKHVQANIAKLVAFSAAIEKNCGVTGRVLWSESEENPAQKLIANCSRRSEAVRWSVVSKHKGREPWITRMTRIWLSG